MDIIIRSVLVFTIIIILFSCGSTSTESNELNTYTPLALGDVTQLIYIEDSSTVMLKITDITSRQDGKTVYEAEFKTGTQLPTISYYLISNGYLVSTELVPSEDTTFVLDGNPYREQRLAKSIPEPGDTWFHTPGDRDSVYVVAEEIGTLVTFLGVVNDVFGFGIYFKNSESPFLISYYSKGMGWIASSGFYFNPSETQFICSYKKVSGKTYGALWPDKDYSDIRSKYSSNPNQIAKSIFEYRFWINGNKLR